MVLKIMQPPPPERPHRDLKIHLFHFILSNKSTLAFLDMVPPFGLDMNTVVFKLKRKMGGGVKAGFHSELLEFLSQVSLTP